MSKSDGLLDWLARCFMVAFYVLAGLSALGVILGAAIAASDGEEGVAVAIVLGGIPSWFFIFGGWAIFIRVSRDINTIRHHLLGMPMADSGGHNNPALDPNEVRAAKSRWEKIDALEARKKI